MNKPFGVCLLPVLLSPAVVLAKAGIQKDDEEKADGGPKVTYAEASAINRKGRLQTGD
jgi:hypothetical protein